MKKRKKVGTSRMRRLMCEAASRRSRPRQPSRPRPSLEHAVEATWSHSLRTVRPGGRIVVAGATSGMQPPADLPRIFFKQLEVVGSTMGTREELVRLVDAREHRAAAAA